MIVFRKGAWLDLNQCCHYEFIHYNTAPEGQKVGTYIEWMTREGVEGKFLVCNSNEPESFAKIKDSFENAMLDPDCWCWTWEGKC